MEVCVMGLGYIGLPMSLMMASHGVSVIGVDCNATIVEKLSQGNFVFQEKGLSELFLEAKSKNIRFSHECPKNNFYIIAVPTPYDPITKKIDASYVAKAMEEVLEVCEEESVIVIESTISPGTINRHIRPIAFRSNKKVHLAHAPERIIPGNIIYELQNNSRTIGSDDLETGKLVQQVYSSFCRGEIVLTDILTAEMSKVVENTFRDINIAYANELARICRKSGMDVYEVIRIANKHPRVQILQPGPGVGGHCISVDPWFLVGDFPEEAKLIRQAREVNSAMPEFVLERIHSILTAEGINDLGKVGLYGLTYKEDVDDTRESPTLQLLDIIKCKGEEMPLVFDPMVQEDLVPRQCHDFGEFLSQVDMVVLLVGHSHIREHLGDLASKVVLDTRNVISSGVYKM